MIPSTYAGLTAGRPTDAGCPAGPGEHQAAESQRSRLTRGCGSEPRVNCASRHHQQHIVPTAGWRTIGMAGRPGQGLRDSERTRLVGGPARLGCHHRDRCKSRDHVAGGIEVMQTPGAALDEAEFRWSGGHESGHPAQPNSQSILKRHSRLKLHKSSSGFCAWPNQNSDTSIVDSRESCQNFCPTHPPQQNTAMPFFKSCSCPVKARAVGHRRLPRVSPDRVRTGPARPYPRDG